MKVITVDGPSGVGKGTTSIALADHLGWHFLDSGAIYRALGWYANHTNVDLEDLTAVNALIGKYELKFIRDKILIDGDDVSSEVRHERCGGWASKIAVSPIIRASLLQSQKEFRQAPGLVADGRDMGTVVFPDANLKIFLKASAKERGRRRFEQLRNTDPSVTISALIDEIKHRDERDIKRATSPLKPAQDAIEIDSSDMSIEEVLNTVLVHASSAGIK